VRLSDLPRPRLDDSRLRIRRHHKTPYEIVFDALVYCLKHQDDEAAALLSPVLKVLDDEE
jgi:hypothetical protein